MGFAGECGQYRTALEFFEKKISCLMLRMIQGDEYCSSGISI
jgi:hypothetical protein